jgi:predicted dehydrogenase
MGKVFVSIGCRRDYTMRSVFYGTKGTIICDNTSDSMKLFIDDRDLTKERASYNDAEIIPVDIKNHNVGSEIKMFLEALTSGKESPLSSIEGASTVAVCAASVEAARVGKPVEIKYPVK